jgi:hypothetical protein
MYRTASSIIRQVTGMLSGVSQKWMLHISKPNKKEHRLSMKG